MGGWKVQQGENTGMRAHCATGNGKANACDEAVRHHHSLKTTNTAPIIMAKPTT